MSQGRRATSELAPLIDRVRSLAASNELKSERVFASQLEVKRHQLRRALQVLRTQGAISPSAVRPRAQHVAHRESLVGDTNPLEVIEMRIAIEPSLARLAALRASPFDIARIVRAAKTAPDMDSGKVDLAFHKAIAAGTSNKLAASFYELLRQIGSDARVRVRTNQMICPKRVQERDEEHRAIAESIAARDPDAAERAMRAHLAAVQKRVMERLTPPVAAL